MTELERFPIEALVALVDRETTILHSDINTYGSAQWDPRTPAFRELAARFEKTLPKKEPQNESNLDTPNQD